MPERTEKSILDLVPNGPIRSDSFKWKGHQVRWRLLDSLEVIACRKAGQGFALDILVNDLGLDRDKAFELLQAGTSSDTEREIFEHYVLAAAMTSESGAPIADGTQEEIAQRLTDLLTPMERAALIEDYLQFANEYNPAGLSEEAAEEIIAALGKGAGEETLKPLGSSVLRSLLLTTVPRLVRAEAALAELTEQTDLAARVEALELVTSQTSKSSGGSG